MTLAVATEVNTVGATGGPNIGLSLGVSVAVGDWIEVFVGHDTTSTSYGCSDSLGNTYTPRNAVGGTSSRGKSFTAPVTNAGTPTVTVTFSPDVSLRAIWLKKITGTNIQFETLAAQEQATPGTGTDAVTTGNGSTLSTQPALYSGIAIDASGTNEPAPGTGYTPGATGWDFGGGVLAASEHKSVSVTTADDATWTAAQNTSHLSMMHVLSETPAGGPAANIVPGIAQRNRRHTGRFL